MAFLSELFGRVGRVARGQANSGVDALEDATFESTVKQTVWVIAAPVRSGAPARRGRAC